MIPDVLTPRLDLLGKDYVLVQAWKKTVGYIRYHNWYSDTLALDRTAVDLPRFIAELAERLRRPDQWESEPLRIVPAPKSHPWRVTGKGWNPVPSPRERQKGQEKAGTRLRPLAHVTVQDQVAATALMMCLANRVETLQGDPRDSVPDETKRRRVISYGNRLFCDARDEELFHRWGSGKLYRAYYQDYRDFLSRPEAVASEIARKVPAARVVIVHSDLRQFYDRVRPELLAQKLEALARPEDDPSFLTLARHLLNWKWDRKDTGEVGRYARDADIEGFSHVALPQGLVASGFFANVTLLDFDQALRESISHEIAPGVLVYDVCRYVDDLRIVATIADHQAQLEDVEEILWDWLQGLLSTCSPGLLVSRKKTRAATFGRDERPLVQQSRRMRRIQSAVSGGFDARGGEEVLDAVLGLMRSQERYSEQRQDGQGWALMPIADVRDATVARFAAGRFRSTYRSLRPLLPDGDVVNDAQERSDLDDTTKRLLAPRTQVDLDDEAKAFALGLIENWVHDPSNVRLLRIGLDLWPAEGVLTSVLELLRRFTEKGGPRGEPRRVARYCLAEIFRAAATETGFVESGEAMPAGIDVDAYRNLLVQEAARLSTLPAAMLPWYLRQQVLLFLAAYDPARAPVYRKGDNPETSHYRELILYLKGESEGLTSAGLVTNAILARRSFGARNAALQLANRAVTKASLESIAERDPSFALEILESTTDLFDMLSPRRRDDLCLRPDASVAEGTRLANIVLEGGESSSVRNELSILEFADKFLNLLPTVRDMGAITPTDVVLQLRTGVDTVEVQGVKVAPSSVSAAGSMYLPPAWCPPDEKWRFQLGYLLRFILAGRQDFTQAVRPPHWKEEKPTYRPAVSHWYQRLYGLYSAQSAFGDDWLPISDWTEQLLFNLLRWPGCSDAKSDDGPLGPESTRTRIQARIEELKEKRGQASGLLLLPLKAPRFRTPGSRPLRACVMQTVIPDDEEYQQAMATGDLTLSGRNIRRRHRGHLSAALAAIRQLLYLRDTHLPRDGRLDWLILPELSVHPRDVATHLIPFARAHRTIILAGLCYESLFARQPLVNSALWVIPTWSSAHGLQVITRRQGKQYLAPQEDQLNSGGRLIQGYRPCQWLIGYEWSAQRSDRPLWLTSSVCYDATDPRLAADLQRYSDVFAVPALNRDVVTFDQMALALHYHMFQMVIVVNNGRYGGSNAYAPYRERYRSQVFHLHGQPQASAAFLEIDDIADFIGRVEEAKMQSSPVPMWKYPPAGR